MDVPHHYGERLIAAPFAFAKPAHSLGVPGIAGQVVAAKPLDGNCQAHGQPMTNFFGRRRNLRSANWASVGLGMESTVVGIVVFRLAVGAHPKRRHRRGRAVVWDVLNNRVARTAIGAVCKWIKITAVAWCGRIAKTLSAGRDIRRYQPEIAHGRPLSRISKPSSLRVSRSEISISAILANTGASTRSAARNSSTAAPSASISTPLSLFRTNPAIRSRLARLKTNGRKPTPCTVPRT